MSNMKSTVKGTVLVKATKVKDSKDEYYLEYVLSDEQTLTLCANLMVAHVENGTLIHETEPSESFKKMKFLKEMIDKSPKMDDETRNQFYREIAILSQSKQ